MKKLLFLFLLTTLAFNSYGQEVVVLNSSSTTVQDAIFGSIVPDVNYGINEPKFSIYNWTINGVLNTVRAAIEFDMSDLPDNIEIVDAKLILYHAAFPEAGIEEHKGENEFYVERITEAWVDSVVTWNTQPASTTLNRAYAPTSSTTTQNYVINVTDMVTDMVAMPDESFGFLLKHVTEQPYRWNIFASSDHEDISLHQELILTYNVITATKTLDKTDGFMVFPNPTDSQVQLKAIGNDVITEVVVRDLLGRRIRRISGPITSIELAEKGTYLLEIISGKKHFVEKIVVQ